MNGIANAIGIIQKIPFEKRGSGAVKNQAITAKKAGAGIKKIADFNEMFLFPEVKMINPDMASRMEITVG
ncbi:MAG: hypothetical protein JEZ00_22140 [Anaerolineaceae bacterium]|nr:hypothetical protein [Anaerolineaceae bacterium]